MAATAQNGFALLTLAVPQLHPHLLRTRATPRAGDFTLHVENYQLSLISCEKHHICCAFIGNESEMAATSRLYRDLVRVAFDVEPLNVVICCMCIRMWHYN
jgi:hypothetical protein